MSTVSSASMTGKDAYIDATSSALSSKSAIVGKDANQLDMDDFLNLLVAQMTNQDMLNPTADTEYIAQMAQFTTLRGIQTIQEYQLSSYAASYAGKTVAIAHTNPTTGALTKTEGVVSAVTFYDGEPKVVVDGISYPLYSVMEVKTPGSSGSDSMTQSEASAYIGKTVTLSYKDDDGDDVEITGLVTGVSTKDSVVHVILDEDEEYPANYITSVK